MTSGNDLQLSERDTLTQVFAQMPYPVMVMTPGGDVVFVNEALRRLWGFSSPGALPGSYNVLDDTGSRRPNLARALRQAALGQAVEVHDLEVRIEDIGRRYGSEKTGTLNVELTAFPVFEDSGSVWRVVIILKDDSRRKADEQALARSESRYRTLAESLADGIYEASLDGTFLYANETALKIFGYDKKEIIGMNIADTIPPSKKAETQRALELLRGGKELIEERTFRRKDGTPFEGDIHVTPIRSEGRVTGIRGVVRDITERKMIARELQKLSKLESLGKLAGGIAHDFNNLLGGLFGNIELALAALDAKDISRAKSVLDQALIAYERACKLSGHILTFADGGQPRKAPGSLSDVIEGALDISSSGSNCKIERVIDDDLWLSLFDHKQIFQVMENLSINAMQSMPDGGTITVTATNVSVGGGDVPQLPPGRYVRISVRDHGPGIPIEDRDKIFDPFFTTKLSSSGLGLSICHSIVKNHGGTIRIAEAPDGEGAEFELYLPAYFDTPADPDEEKQSSNRQENRRVLCMDDELLLRNITSEMLRAIGCEVDTAEHGDKAVEMYEEAQQNGRPYALVFLDLTVPGHMGGKQALDILKSRHPQIVAVATSGYSNDPIMATPTSFGFADKLAKPYRMTDLSNLVKKLLPPT